MKINKLNVLAPCLSGVLAKAQITPGFQPGNLSVLRIGSTDTPRASSGDPVFLDEYTTNGIFTNSIAIPGLGPTSLIIEGTATSEGAINRSANGNFMNTAPFAFTLTNASGWAQEYFCAVYFPWGAKGRLGLDAMRVFKIVALLILLTVVGTVESSIFRTHRFFVCALQSIYEQIGPDVE
jgi:hypothetical protein